MFKLRELGGGGCALNHMCSLAVHLCCDEPGPMVELGEDSQLLQAINRNPPQSQTSILNGVLVCESVSLFHSLEGFLYFTPAVSGKEGRKKTGKGEEVERPSEEQKGRSSDVCVFDGGDVGRSWSDAFLTHPLSCMRTLSL